MLGGISSRWKQIVAYHFTDKSSEAYKSIVCEIIKIAEQIGLKVHCVTSDMGSLNQAMWKSFGIKSGRTKNGKLEITNYVSHPMDSTRKLFFVADVPHIFKNITNSFSSNKTIEFDEDTV